MLHKLIDLSPDLKKLKDEGYGITIRDNHIIIEHIPYIDSVGQIKKGSILSPLVITAGIAGKPKNHVVYFKGDFPCNKDGTPISSILHSNRVIKLSNELSVDRSFSNKPKGGFSDYYEQFISYINIISGPAISLDNKVTPRIFISKEIEVEDSVFNYPDTNSSRAGISFISDKLRSQKVGLIGVGGTGSYVLDFLAKCPIREIRIFDNDEFSIHNAFRSPGAPDSEELNRTIKKVQYFSGIYSKMHKNIIVNEKYIVKSNLEELNDLDFVFICIDKGSIKKEIIKHLSDNEISFIDVGMGIEIAPDDKLTGMLRATFGPKKETRHIEEKGIISFADMDDEIDEYSQNIQIAELNALNAALAVIKWKKYYGFYHDDEEEVHMIYSIEDNSILNENFKK